MSGPYLLLKVAHIIGASVLLGTGIGIAFFMWMANRTGEARIIAATARVVVIADALFTAAAIVIQPVTGVALAEIGGVPLSSSWIAWSVMLYFVAGACWLPVVWIQIRLRNLASEAEAASNPLPPAYHRLFRAWFILGWPAFVAVIAILALMIAKPTL
jgi:uncharacterized membrane protein